MPNPVIVDETAEVDAPPAALWPFYADTDAMNRAMGLPVVSYEARPEPTGGSIVTARARYGGLRLEWREFPFEWVEPRSYSVRREFTRGDTLALYAEVYDRVTRDMPEHQVEVNTYVRSMSGERVIVATERRSSSAPRRTSGGLGFTVPLPLAGFAPGKYVLVMEAQVRGGQVSDAGPVVTREVPIVIR